MSKPQTEKVAEYIDRHGTITQKEATDNLGITRLADVVFKLRKQGREFDAPLIDVRNRDGDICRVSRYSWKSDRPALVLEAE